MVSMTQNDLDRRRKLAEDAVRLNMSQRLQLAAWERYAEAAAECDAVADFERAHTVLTMLRAFE